MNRNNFTKKKKKLSSVFKNKRKKQFRFVNGNREAKHE